jgi:uncharacterized membrane protein YkvA (DUF1232 family)
MSLQGCRQRFGSLRPETYAMYFAYTGPRVPWYANGFAACLAGYVFSPMGLFPIADFVPVLWQLDELVVVPVDVVIARKMIPDQVIAEAREKVKALEGKPVNRKAAAVIASVWLPIGNASHRPGGPRLRLARDPGATTGPVRHPKGYERYLSAGTRVS